MVPNVVPPEAPDVVPPVEKPVVIPVVVIPVEAVPLVPVVVAPVVPPVVPAVANPVVTPVVVTPVVAAVVPVVVNPVVMPVVIPVVVTPVAPTVVPVVPAVVVVVVAPVEAIVVPVVAPVVAVPLVPAVVVAGGAWVTRRRAPVEGLARKMFEPAARVPDVREEESETNATQAPSWEMAGFALFPCGAAAAAVGVVPALVPVALDPVEAPVVPPVVVPGAPGWLKRRVVPVRRSRTKTFDPPLAVVPELPPPVVPEVVAEVLPPEVEAPKRFPAFESKATKRPSPEIDGLWLSASAGVIVVPGGAATVTRTDCPLSRSHTKMFVCPVCTMVTPPAGRLLAVDSNVTNRPSPLREGLALSPLRAPVPVAGSGVTIVVIPTCRSRRTILTRPATVLPELPAPKFPAADWNPTNRPSAEMLGFVLSALGLPPPAVWLTSWI